METKISKISKSENYDTYLDEASEIIKKGGIVAFPTETVYGLGANALDENAVKKIFIAKGRPQDNPLIIHVAHKDISKYVKEVPKIASEIMDKFWPGPITLILFKKPIIPDVTSASLDTIGVRMPDNKIAQELIKRSRVPIAAPSANISGRPSPTDLDRCAEDLDGRVDYIIGGEKCKVGVESTILDCTVDPPIILRPGGITLEMLQKIDNRIKIDKGILVKSENTSFKPKAPGMKYKHYAPKAPVKIIKGNKDKTIEKIIEMIQYYSDEGKIVGVLSSSENSRLYKNSKVITLGKDLNEIAKNLFKALRDLDDLGVDIILSEAFEETGVGLAIMNRLNKAAGFDITIV